MPLVLTLEEMTRPGYIAAVHCDVSTGHILIDSHGKARLSDLEYAKDMSDKSDPESRIGTTNFVAAEVQSQAYEFRPRDPIRFLPFLDTSGIASHVRETSVDSNICSEIAHRGTVLSPFRYNPLHDLESLWWIAVYFVFTTEVLNTLIWTKMGERVREHWTSTFQSCSAISRRENWI